MFCRWWGIGYLILDKDDPTRILQRESRVLWPTLGWERADPADPQTAWECDLAPKGEESRLAGRGGGAAWRA